MPLMPGPEHACRMQPAVLLAAALHTACRCGLGHKPPCHSEEQVQELTWLDFCWDVPVSTLYPASLLARLAVLPARVKLFCTQWT